jgi:hypothetical protein
MQKFFGISLIVLALGIAILPQFTHCKSLSSDLASKMPCQQSAAAEIVVGAPLAVVGASALFTRRKDGFLALSFIGIVLGVSAILIPTKLIGVCPGGLMHCNVYMRPILLFLGTVTVGMSGGMLASTRKLKD